MSAIRFLLFAAISLCLLIVGCGDTKESTATTVDAIVSADTGGTTGTGDVVKPDPCDGVDCGTGGTCKEGECECSTGYELDNKQCADINECATDNGGCGDIKYNTCTNNPGAAATCTDIDECETENGGCGDNANCTNQKNADPICSCAKGYIDDADGKCVKTPECAMLDCADNS